MLADLIDRAGFDDSARDPAEARLVGVEPHQLLPSTGGGMLAIGVERGLDATSDRSDLILRQRLRAGTVGCAGTVRFAGTARRAGTVRLAGAGGRNAEDQRHHGGHRRGNHRTRSRSRHHHLLSIPVHAPRSPPAHQISTWACGSNCMAPATLPSGSRKKIKWPTVGMSVRGMTMVPPLASTAAATASTSLTAMLHS